MGRLEEERMKRKKREREREKSWGNKMLLNPEGNISVKIPLRFTK